MTNPSETTSDITNQAEQNYFNKLPDEGLLAIFLHVGTAGLITLSKVCRRFHSVSQDKVLWKKISLPQSKITARRLEDIITTHAEIEELDLSGSTVALPIFAQAREVEDFVINLNTLNLSNIQYVYSYPRTCTRHFGPAIFCHVYNGIKHMLEIFETKKLIIDHIKITCLTYPLFSQVRQLETLSMEYFTASTLIDCRDFFFQLDQLRELDLSNSSLSSNQWLGMCHLPSNVEKFMLNNVDLGPQYLKIFEEIVTCASNLKYLGVSLEYLNQPVVLAILSKLEKLKSSRLYHSEWNKARLDLENILETLENLENIYFMTEQVDALCQMQKDEIQTQVATLSNQLNVRLGIEAKVNIFNDSWKLHLHKLQ